MRSFLGKTIGRRSAQPQQREHGGQSLGQLRKRGKKGDSSEATPFYTLRGGG
jgi:hypothetical protein